MTRFRVIYSYDALKELRGIRRYISRKLNNPSAASKQVAHIMLAAESLAVFPKLYRVRQVDTDGNEIRFFQVDNYTIIYYVDESRKTINVIHVIYSRRNIDALIRPCMRE